MLKSAKHIAADPFTAFRRHSASSSAAPTGGNVDPGFSSGGGVSIGAIVGSVLGSLLSILLASGILAFWIKKRRQHRCKLREEQNWTKAELQGVEIVPRGTAKTSELETPSVRVELEPVGVSELQHYERFE